MLCVLCRCALNRRWTDSKTIQTSVSKLTPIRKERERKIYWGLTSDPLRPLSSERNIVWHLFEASAPRSTPSRNPKHPIPSVPNIFSSAINDIWINGKVFRWSQREYDRYLCFNWMEIRVEEQIQANWNCFGARKHSSIQWIINETKRFQPYVWLILAFYVDDQRRHTHEFDRRIKVSGNLSTSFAERSRNVISASFLRFFFCVRCKSFFFIIPFRWKFMVNT